jgi:hypothetical protein
MRTWSFSSMNTFYNCPKQYQLTYVTPVIPYQETEATIWGTRVHEALEHYGRDGVELKEEFVPYKKYVDRILALPGEKLFEQQFAFTRNLEYTDFNDGLAWCRGVIDVAVIDGDRAIAADYKTGKVRPDSDQLKLFAAFIMQKHPEVLSVKTVYLWVKFGQTTVETYTRSDLPSLWAYFMAKAARLEKAYESDKWTPKPSGLCRGWCGAKQHCVHWAPRT